MAEPRTVRETPNALTSEQIAAMQSAEHYS